MVVKKEEDILKQTDKLKQEKFYPKSELLVNKINSSENRGWNKKAIFDWNESGKTALGIFELFF